MTFRWKWKPNRVIAPYMSRITYPNDLLSYKVTSANARSLCKPLPTRNRRLSWLNGFKSNLLFINDQIRLLIGWVVSIPIDEALSPIEMLSISFNLTNLNFDIQIWRNNFRCVRLWHPKAIATPIVSIPALFTFSMNAPGEWNLFTQKT